MTRMNDRIQTQQNSESGLTTARAEALFVSRKAMLVSLRGDINMNLHDMISKKIEYEYEYLLQGATYRLQELDAQKILRAALRPEYFVQKKLDLNAL